MTDMTLIAATRARELGWLIRRVRGLPNSKAILVSPAQRHQLALFIDRVGSLAEPVARDLDSLYVRLICARPTTKFNLTAADRRALKRAWPRSAQWVDRTTNGYTFFVTRSNATTRLAGNLEEVPK